MMSSQNPLSVGAKGTYEGKRQINLDKKMTDLISKFTFIFF